MWVVSSLLEEEELVYLPLSALGTCLAWTCTTGVELGGRESGEELEAVGEGEKNAENTLCERNFSTKKLKN